MTLLGAATSPRTPPAPEDHASTSSWIQAQGWKDDRKRLAHEELHKRVGLANGERSAAQDVAKETGLALAKKLARTSSRSTSCRRRSAAIFPTMRSPH